MGRPLIAVGAIFGRMLTALQIGADPLLLETRAAVLGSAGLGVVSVASVRQAAQTIRGIPFDLVILCHSLSRADRAALAGAVRRLHSSAPILLVAGGPNVHSVREDGVDAVLDPDPRGLLQGIRQLLQSAEKDEDETCPRRVGHA